jgi:isopropylmalate/homocitrate/citramalate synthase
MAIWETKDIIVVTAAVVGASVTVIVPVINHFLSRWRYGREKIWDLQREVCNEVLSEILNAITSLGCFITFSKEHAFDTMRQYLTNAQAALSKAWSAQRRNCIVCSGPFQRRLG